jgi:hypothetical protein
MNLGQILLIIFALALLSTLQLTVNSSVLRASLITMDNEARIDAISIAQAMIDEINSKAFDSSTVYKVANFTYQLTPYYNFGPEGSELSVGQLDQEPFLSKTMYNDIDDYHGYTRLDHSSHLGTFLVRDSVIYVDSLNHNSFSSSQTWYKKIIVVVKHPNMIDSLAVNYYLLDSVMTKSLAVYRQYF